MKANTCFKELIVCCLLGYLSLAICASAEECCYESDSKATKLVIGTYTWLPYFEGNMTIRGNTAFVNASIIDLIKMYDSLAIFVVRADMQCGKWGAYSDIQYGRPAFNDLRTSIPLLTLNTKFEFSILEIVGKYRLYEYAHGCGSCQRFTTDLLLGVRHSRYNIEMDLSTGQQLKEVIEWIDPIIGTRIVADLTSYLDLYLHGDIGGFGLGSHFTWKIDSGFRYHFRLFSHPAIVALVYRALDQIIRRTEGD